MTTNKKYLVLITKCHALYKSLKDLDVNLFDVEEKSPFEEEWSNHSKYDLVIDLSVVPSDKKLKILSEISNQLDGPIISDLSSYWGDFFTKKISGLTGAVSTNFPSPTNCYEYYANDERTNKEIESFFELINIEGLRVSSAGIGFTYPRVISMIVNEAFFSLEDHLALPKDIDTAMKFGVNYPLGPFDWGKKIGHKNILRLLEELYKVTGDPRYRPSQKLRLEANLT